MSEFNPSDYFIDYQGKPYLPVAARVMWFRQVHPAGRIVTSQVSATKETGILYQAQVFDGEGKLLAVTHKHSLDYGVKNSVDKAETGAIGRALANAGFGTLFAGEDLDEGDDIADAPANPPAARALPNHAPVGGASDFLSPAQKGKILFELKRTGVDLLALTKGKPLEQLSRVEASNVITKLMEQKVDDIPF